MKIKRKISANKSRAKKNKKRLKLSFVAAILKASKEKGKKLSSVEELFR